MIFRAGLGIAIILGIFLILPGGYASRPKVTVLTLSEDSVNPATADYLVRGISSAAREGAECVILRLDTPGGLLTSTRLIVREILSSPVPVVVYVCPGGARAGSAGVFITYAAHIAAMAPSTHIGAAHPVSVGRKEERTIWDALRDLIDEWVRRYYSPGKDEPGGPPRDEADHPIEDKILNDTVAFIKAMARERGRNVEWAEKSVVESSSVTETEALDMGVIDLVASDIRDLLGKIHGREVSLGTSKKILNTENAYLEFRDLDFRQKILNILANPNMAYMFLMLGFYGLLFEVTHPGFGVPGVLGTVFMILGLYSLQMLPTNYAGLGLMFVGILLFAAEVWVPGFGLLTLGGIACLLLGSFFLFDTTEGILRVSSGLVFGFAGATAAITFGLLRVVVRSHRQKAMTGMEGMLGLTGEVAEGILPDRDGKVFVHGELWTAFSRSEIAKGKRVRVAGYQGMRLEVEPEADVDV